MTHGVCLNVDAQVQLDACAFIASQNESATPISVIRDSSHTILDRLSNVEISELDDRNVLTNSQEILLTTNDCAHADSEIGGGTCGETIKEGALTEIAGKLHSPHKLEREELFTMVSGLGNEVRKWDVLCEIATQIHDLEKDEREKLFTITDNLVNDNHKWSVLAKIATQICDLEKDEREKLLSMAGALTDEVCKWSVLVKIVAQIRDLEKGEREKLLSMVGGFTDEICKWSALLRVAEQVNVLGEDERTVLLCELASAPEETKSKSLAYVYDSIYVLSEEQATAFFDLLGTVQNPVLRAAVVDIPNYAQFRHDIGLFVEYNGSTLPIKIIFDQLSDGVIREILNFIATLYTPKNMAKALISLLSRQSYLRDGELEMVFSMVSSFSLADRAKISGLLSSITDLSATCAAVLTDRYDGLPESQKNEALGKAVKNLREIAGDIFSKMSFRCEEGFGIENRAKEITARTIDILTLLGSAEQFPSLDVIADVCRSMGDALDYSIGCADSMSTAAEILEIRLKLLQAPHDKNSTIAERVRLMHTIWVNGAIDAVFSILDGALKGKVDESLEGALLLKTMRRILPEDGGTAKMEFAGLGVDVIRAYGDSLKTMTAETFPILAPFQTFGEMEGKYTKLKPFQDLRSGLAEISMEINGTTVAYETVLPVLLLVYHYLERNPMKLEEGHCESMAGNVTAIPIECFPGTWAGYDGAGRNFQNDFRETIAEVDAALPKKILELEKQICESTVRGIDSEQDLRINRSELEDARKLKSRIGEILGSGDKFAKCCPLDVLREIVNLDVELTSTGATSIMEKYNGVATNAGEKTINPFGTLLSSAIVHSFLWKTHESMVL
ncbi:MAG: hypothetical protein LBB18_02355 [Puniceicoccales bacterium]|jgi:hypothetical protein|nr:hypothetical protein [Puniceicoccales bacterium]